MNKEELMTNMWARGLSHEDLCAHAHELGAKDIPTQAEYTRHRLLKDVEMNVNNPPAPVAEEIHFH